MFTELEKQMDSVIDGKIRAQKAINEAFYDGDVRVSKDDLNLLLHYNIELYNIAWMLYEMLNEVPADTIEGACNREGARVLMNEYQKKHRNLINKLALEKLTGIIRDE